MVAVQAWSELGERVREARVAAGLSQGQLAALVGLDRTAIVRIEGGQRQVSALELFGIADTLGMTLAHFVNRSPEAMVSRRQQLREAPDSAERLRFALDAALEAHARDTEQLVAAGMLVPPALSEPVPVRTAADAVGLARDVRRRIEVTGPLGPLAAVAEQLGLYNTVVDIDADGASMLPDSYGVAVIGNTEPGRRRWSAAHELGHHVMRDEYHTDVGIAASRDDREQLIDAFAGELLLPIDELTARVEAGGSGHDLWQALISIAADYRVSWSVAVDRARRAGLVDNGQAQRLRARSPVRGDFLALLGREPEPDLPLGDHGPQWTQAVLRAHHRGLMADERVIELLAGRIKVEDLPEVDAG